MSRKLGRGLDSLLQGSRQRGRVDSPPAGDQPVESEPAESASVGEPVVARPGGREVLSLRVDAVEPNPHQPRLSFDRAELDALKASIANDGVLQPVVVRPVGSGYQLVAGERRFRACQDLGLQTVPAVVAEVPDDRLLELALVENIHREDLNPIDLARAFQKLQELKGWTQEALARQLGLGRPTVANTLRLLELPEAMQSALARGQIQIGHAKVLLSVTNPLDRQKLFDRIAEDRLSVRELETTRDALEPSAPSEKPRGGGRKTSRSRKATKPSNVLDLEAELARALGTRVDIEERKGKGLIRIEFYSPEDFQTIRRLLLAGRKES